ncbi:MAG TPA: hypothetical protein VJ810_35470 [Blastocatellia bacterium]|nr:hypothetical protein [Blastocatellia bacterium]
MFRSTITLMTLLLSVAIGNAQVSPVDPAVNRTQNAFEQETRDQADPLSQMLVEISKLRSELEALRQEFQRGRIAELERELRLTQANAERLAEREREIHQQITALDQQLGQPSLSDEERKELEAEKAELAGDLLAPLRSEQQAVAEREAETAKRLAHEQQRLQALVDKRAREKGRINR